MNDLILLMPAFHGASSGLLWLPHQAQGLCTTPDPSTLTLLPGYPTHPVLSPHEAL